jgi:ribosome-interacting GTPase 1
MPANLPPQYFEAEKRLHAAKSPEERVMIIEEMLAVMPKHKGTDHLKADLRRKIALIQEEAQKKGGGKRASMLIDKEGAAQVVVIGLPNSGKSQLVAAVTSAAPVVADYPFTTQVPLPGMMEFENIKIQLIDTPPLTEEPAEWWLRNMIIRADGMLVVIDLTQDPLAQMETIISQLRGMRINIGSLPVAGEELILHHKKALVLANKAELDMGQGYGLLQAKFAGLVPLVAISAKTGAGLEDLRRQIFDMLEIIRVYTKTPGKKAEMTEPIVLPRGATLAAAAAEVHKDFLAKLKYARIWGSGKHDGVMASRDHVLQDGDIIELHM